MKVVAMIDRSAGNESVGEMWTETKIFDSTDTIDSLYAWITPKVVPYGKPKDVRSNIKLSVAQDSPDA